MCCCLVNDSACDCYSGTYDLPFILAGIPPIVGALLMFIIRCVKQNDDGNSDNSSATNAPNKTDCQNGW